MVGFLLVHFCLWCCHDIANELIIFCFECNIGQYLVSLIDFLEFVHRRRLFLIQIRVKLLGHGDKAVPDVLDRGAFRHSKGSIIVLVYVY